MAILKWLGYLALLFSFIWFVFFRGSAFNGFSGFNKTKVENTSANVNDGVSDLDEVDAALIDDENAFIDDDINDLDAGLEGEGDEKIGGEYEDETIADSKSTNAAEGTETDNATSNTSQGNNTSNSIIDLDKKFYVIVGSFGQKANAERMLKRVRDSGKQGIIKKINGLHRVITATTDSNRDARNLRDHFTTIYKETAFVMER